MRRQSESAKNGKSNDTGVDVSPWRTLFRLARPLRARILIIICLEALSTGATVGLPASPLVDSVSRIWTSLTRTLKPNLKTKGMKRSTTIEGVHPTEFAIVSHHS